MARNTLAGSNRPASLFQTPQEHDMSTHSDLIRTIAANVEHLSTRVAELLAERDAARAEVERLPAELARVNELRSAIAEPPPLFEFGKCYRDRQGVVKGPIRDSGSENFPLTDGDRTWRADGRWWSCYDSPRNLVPGEVPPPEPPIVWNCAASLPDGEYYDWPGHTHFGTYSTVLDAAIVDSADWESIYRDWTDPPRHGRWKVIRQGYAEWQGE
jgi:uncharacterized small protein (DUF1192 family)